MVMHIYGYASVGRFVLFPWREVDIRGQEINPRCAIGIYIHVQGCLIPGDLKSSVIVTVIFGGRGVGGGEK